MYFGPKRPHLKFLSLIPVESTRFDMSRMDVVRPMCHYQVLGVSLRATEDEIRKAYRQYVFVTGFALLQD